MGKWAKSKRIGLEGIFYVKGVDWIFSNSQPLLEMLIDIRVS
jgi:hypothetical protein